MGSGKNRDACGFNRRRSANVCRRKTYDKPDHFNELTLKKSSRLKGLESSRKGKAEAIKNPRPVGRGFNAPSGG